MKIAMGADEKTHLTDFVVEELKKRGHKVTQIGALTQPQAPWPDVAEEVAKLVSTGQADHGVLCCWTGTGVSMAANKIPGIRAALCNDAQTARGARLWNDANVLVMSLRSTSEAVAKEMLDEWFKNNPEESELQNIKKIEELEKKYGRQKVS